MSKKSTKEKFVTTINNENLPISKTRKYENGYYKIGNPNVKNSGDCYLMENGSYYREETGQIVFNYSENKYCFKNDNLVYGIVNSDLEWGYFNNNVLITNVVLEDDRCVEVMNRNILKNNLNFREFKLENIFYHISKIKAKDFNKLYVIKDQDKHILPYNSSNVLKSYIETYEKYYVERNDIVDDFKEIVNDYSFGLEFETIKGKLSNNVCHELGLIPLRDGSISGLEYATVPLNGSKGISTIVDIVEELNQKTIYDDKCSLHLHIGNVPRTMKFILAFYKMTLFFQDQIFELFPLYKKYNFRYKNKNYAAPYNGLNNLLKMDENINDSNIFKNFNLLFYELSEGFHLQDFGDNGDLSQIKHHPKDPNGEHKWNINTRYYIHNLIPLLFGNKQTIEFRIHTPTTDVKKVLWFITFNMLFVDFVVNNQNIILGKDFNLIPKNLYHLFQQKLLNTPKLSKNFVSQFLKTFDDRKKKTEFFNHQSNIFHKETDIKCNFDYLKKNIELEHFKHDDYKSFAGLENNNNVEKKIGIPTIEKLKELLESSKYSDPFLNNNPFYKSDTFSFSDTAEFKERKARFEEEATKFADHYVNHTQNIVNEMNSKQKSKKISVKNTALPNYSDGWDDFVPSSTNDSINVVNNNDLL